MYDLVYEPLTEAWFNEFAQSQERHDDRWCLIVDIYRLSGEFD